MCTFYFEKCYLNITIAYYEFQYFIEYMCIAQSDSVQSCQYIWGIKQHVVIREDSDLHTFNIDRT